MVVTTPTITGLAPASGTSAGGTTVAITGSGFVGLSGTAAVTFGGTAAKSYTVTSDTTMTAVSPAHAAGPVRVQVTALGGTTADTPADDFTYVAPPVTYQQTSTSLSYSGTWSSVYTSSASGGSYRRSRTAGAYVIIPFYGTRLDWVATKGYTQGMANIYVDGVQVAKDLNLYRSSTAYRQVVWSSGPLAPGYHWVKIQRSPASVSTRYLNLDAAVIYGTVVANTRKEQTDSHLLWSPSLSDWTQGTNSTTYYSGGSYRFINKTGSVTINFTGISLNIIAKKTWSYGIASVSIDGGPPRSVNLYRSTTAYKQTVWSSGWLIPGDHSVTFSWTGTKSGSTGTTIDIDAVDVRGVLR